MPSLHAFCCNTRQTSSGSAEQQSEFAESFCPVFDESWFPNVTTLDMFSSAVVLDVALSQRAGTFQICLTFDEFCGTVFVVALTI